MRVKVQWRRRFDVLGFQKARSTIEKRRRRREEGKMEAGVKRSLRAKPDSLRAKWSFPSPSADVS